METKGLKSARKKVEGFIEITKNRHDFFANQWYSQKNNLRYSFHLECVFNQADFLISLEEEKGNVFSDKEKELIVMGCFGHDLIEDARITYNEIKEKHGEDIADVIFGCTESTGKNRDERHDDEFYKRLTTNKYSKYSVFVKLCDIRANFIFGLLENSGMIKNPIKEFPTFLEKTALFHQHFPFAFADTNKLIFRI